MIIQHDLIRASVARWKKQNKVAPAALAQQLGEGERDRVTQPQREARFASLLSHARDPMVARTQLERVIGGNDLTGINYLAIGTMRALSVCRVHLRDSTGRTVGFGTGFLVGPGVVMTNHHVIGGADDARNALVEFLYEYDVDGIDRPIVAFQVVADPAPVTNQSLDFCLVRIAPRSLDGKHSIEDFGWLPLNPEPGKSIVGEYLSIIQHPSGERKQVCVRENKLLRYDEGGTTLWYMTDTTAGSSGSPVFNGTWQVVALHHSGVPATNDKGQWLTVDGKVWDNSMDETRVKWVANEGVRISSLLQFLATSYARDPLARTVLDAGAPPSRRVTDESRANGGPASELVGDELRLTIPVRVSVRLDTGAIRSPNGRDVGQTTRSLNGNADGRPVLGPTPLSGLLPAAAPSAVERVEVRQDNYGERTGYDPNFLGKRKLAIPLPSVTKAALKKNVLTFGTGQRKSALLDYWNYSVVLHKGRRLAFFSAINVDGGLRKGQRDKDGDRWFFDTRIEKKYQLGPEFYGEQKAFEVDRAKNPFDRGHLSARNDAQWGKTAKEAKRNGDDSFHWVNCSPQHYLFNQGQKLWNGLEDYVIASFAKDADGRASVFNGPIFDAPLSSLGSDGRPVLNVRGKAHPDPVFGDSGVAIPKMFFKVVASVRGGGLAVAAFIISQEDLLATVDRIRGLPPLTQERLTAAEARAFQVSVADVARLTGLDFGPLHDADTMNEEVFSAQGPREVRRYEQLSVSASP